MIFLDKRYMKTKATWIMKLTMQTYSINIQNKGYLLASKESQPKKPHDNNIIEIAILLKVNQN